MARCSACSKPTPEGGRFCPSCGEPLDGTDTPTGTAPQPVRSPAPVRARTPSSGPAAGGWRFVAGIVLADRYRVVTPIGRGGMGEVYRADDLKLGQSVALKFLPESVQDDADRLERLFNEVRLAREISHPAVCRVHDVVEAEGRHFISMEYIDGEDLATLIPRIGRLPGDKALEIARQLCAGLAAAHERGVLHRDFKPQNVMLDGRGKARITDFGLATLAAHSIDDVRSGTPAYMAPEQLEGREVTVRSDVYALGLVMYELFTGRRAVSGRTIDEISRRHHGEPPATPSSVVADIDAAVERAILRCLEKDPRDRPPSALAVAGMLPGGDPLAAALAAGETPSPELVAASGRTDGMSIRGAWLSLGTLVFGTLLCLALAPRTHLLSQVALDKPPAVLEDRAHAVVAALGYDTTPGDFISGFAVDNVYWQRQVDNDASPRSRGVLRAEANHVFQYWYRQSSWLLVPKDRRQIADWNDPPFTESGMVGVRLDPQGRLLLFYAILPRVDREDEPEAADHPPPWDTAFAEAGLDPKRFQAVRPRRWGSSLVDTRAAWEGTRAEHPDFKLRVEAAAFRGRLTNFQMLSPWHGSEASPGHAALWGRWVILTVAAVSVAIFVGIPALLARHHLRAGRGDRAGARRLAFYVLASMMVGWALRNHHVPHEYQIDLTFTALAGGLLFGSYLWLLYLALEPFVRRTAPLAIVSWTRVLAGRRHDPLVGRDVLLGTAAGAAMAGIGALALVLPSWLGQTALAPRSGFLNTLLGWGHSAGVVARFQFEAMVLGMGLLLLWCILHGGKGQRRRLATALTVAAAGYVATPVFAFPDAIAVSVATMAVFGAAVTWILLRAGLLAAIVGLWVSRLFYMPLTPDLGNWFGTPTCAVLAVLFGLAVWSTRTTLAGRTLLKVSD